MLCLVQFQVRTLLSILVVVGLSVFSDCASAQVNSPVAEIVPQLGHQFGITGIALSRDGQFVVSASKDRTLKLWDTKRGREIRTFNGRSFAISSVAFSPDGQQIVSGGQDGKVRLWDAASGRELRSWGLTTDVTSVAFSPDGRRVVAVDVTGMKLWDVDSGNELRTFGGSFASVAFSPDGRQIASGDAVGSAGSAVRLWDINSAREVSTLTGHSSWILFLAFSPDGRRIVSGSGDKTIRLWSLDDAREIRTYAGHSDEVRSVAFSSDGRSIVSGSTDSTVKVWDTQSGQLLRTFTGHDRAVNSVVFLPDGRRIASAGDDSVIRLWNIDTGREYLAIKGQTNWIGSVSFSPDNTRIVTGSKNKTIALWDIGSGRRLRFLKGHTDFVSAVAFSPNGQGVISGSNDKTVKLWDAGNGNVLRTFPGYSDDGGISGANDNDIRLTRNRFIAVSADGHRIAASIGEVVKLWDLESGREIHAYKSSISGGEVNDAVGIAFSPDGSKILSGGVFKTTLLDTASGQTVRTLKSGSHAATSMAFSADGRRFVSGFTKGIEIRDANNGRQLLAFAANAGRIESLAFSPDGSQVVSGGFDNIVRLWDAGTGRELRQFAGHSEQITAVSFSSDARRVVSGSADGTTKLWNVESGELIGTAISFADGEWIFLTPEGFFDASSPKGAQNLTVVQGFEVYSIDQFRDVLFRPDLVKAKLAGDPDGVVKAAATKLDLNKVVGSGNAPAVAITSPADGSAAATGEVDVEATVSEQGGGVGRIEWRLNGQPVGIDTRGFQRVQNNMVAGATTRISQKIVLDAGDNVVEVVAYNARGLVASQPSRIKIKATGTVVIANPRLFVLAVGVNDYFDGRLTLNFAVPDARAIAASFEKAGAGLYDSVKTVTVLDGDVTRANLEKVFAQLASEVKTSDVFIFFVAGHGRTLEGHYYFLPQDFRYRDQDSFAENGLSQEQWQKWITTVQARKSVLIYDTCESGAVTADNVVVASRGLQRVEEQAVAYQKLRDATGKTILAASTDTQPALEGYHGHGLFSYEVMEALEKAQTNANGLIEVTGLISYLDDKVPDVSYQAFHQRQIPQNKMQGSNFAIAKPTAMALGSPVNVPAMSTPNPTAASDRPTHVVIAPADVYEQLGGKGARIEQLPPGTLISLVKTEQGWTLIAKDGKPVGYVAADHLAHIQ